MRSGIDSLSGYERPQGGLNMKRQKKQLQVQAEQPLTRRQYKQLHVNGRQGRSVS